MARTCSGPLQHTAQPLLVELHQDGLFLRSAQSIQEGNAVAPAPMGYGMCGARGAVGKGGIASRRESGLCYQRCTRREAQSEAAAVE